MSPVSPPAPPSERNTSVVVMRQPEVRPGERLCLHVFDRDSAWKHPLADEVDAIIGRGEAAGLRLADGSVSRAHARLEVRNRRARIVDLGSANGVAVNGERITATRDLAPRDIVTLGRSTLILLYGGPAAAALLPLAELERRIAALLGEAGEHRRTFSLLLVAFSAAPRRLAAERAAEQWDVAWMGGRELLVLLPDVAADAARDAADALLDGLSEPTTVEAAYVSVPAEDADPDDLDALLARLRGALAEHDVSRVTTGTVHHLEIGDRSILVADPAMARLYELLERLAPAELPVLVGGETGVGKEAAARFLHFASARAGKPFVALNCASLPENLAESELFGYEKGAFSGAAAAKPGLFESAAGGTVFLDEVGELSATMQAKLLRVLDSKRTRRLGDVNERTVDIRVVSATNRDLQQDVRAGRFRQDLYFRLSAAHVWVPPLRERPRELTLLAREFVAEACARLGRAPLRLGQSALAALAAHDWPGNVRELKNVGEYVAAAVDDTAAVEAVDLPAGFGATAAPAPADPTPAPADITHESEGAAPARALQDEVRELERRRMVQALEDCGGNQSRAAALIRMPRRTFVAKLKQYNIKRG